MVSEEGNPPQRQSDKNEPNSNDPVVEFPPLARDSRINDRGLQLFPDLLVPPDGYNLDEHTKKRLNEFLGCVLHDAKARAHKENRTPGNMHPQIESRHIESALIAQNPPNQRDALAHIILGASLTLLASSYVEISYESNKGLAYLAIGIVTLLIYLWMNFRK